MKFECLNLSLVFLYHFFFLFSSFIFLSSGFLVFVIIDVYIFDVVIDMYISDHHQALDGAIKQYKALSPATSAMFFTVDTDANKVLCMCAVPKVSTLHQTESICTFVERGSTYNY